MGDGGGEQGFRSGGSGCDGSEVGDAQLDSFTPAYIRGIVGIATIAFLAYACSDAISEYVGYRQAQVQQYLDIQTFAGSLGQVCLKVYSKHTAISGHIMAGVYRHILKHSLARILTEACLEDSP